MFRVCLGASINDTSIVGFPPNRANSKLCPWLANKIFKINREKMKKNKQEKLWKKTNKLSHSPSGNSFDFHFGAFSFRFDFLLLFSSIYTHAHEKHTRCTTVSVCVCQGPFHSHSISFLSTELNHNKIGNWKDTRNFEGYTERRRRRSRRSKRKKQKKIGSELGKLFLIEVNTHAHRVGLFSNFFVVLLSLRISLLKIETLRQRGRGTSSMGESICQ